MTQFSLLRPNTSGPYADITNASLARNLWPFPFLLQLLLLTAKRDGRWYRYSDSAPLQSGLTFSQLRQFSLGVSVA